MQNEKTGGKKRISPLLIFTAVISVCCLFCCFIIIALQLFSMHQSEEDLPVTQITASDNTDMQTHHSYTEEEYLLAISEARAEADSEAKAEIKQEIKELYMNATSVVDGLRALYPDDVVFYHEGGYQFVPINPDLPAFPYNKENIQVLENKEIQYIENQEVVSIKGIDISKYQENVDWEKVAAGDVQFAMIRVGIRGYGTGEIVMDGTFEANMSGATAAGMDVGVYFFSQAVNETEAIEEANFVLEKIAPYPVTYPIVLDVEEVNDSTARTANLTREERTKCAVAFLETIRNAGYTPMIYGNLKSFFHMLDFEQVKDYERWFAFYDTDIYFPYDVSIWQYTDKGAVDGINGNVDLNIMFQKKEWEHP